MKYIYQMLLEIVFSFYTNSDYKTFLSKEKIDLINLLYLKNDKKTNKGLNPLFDYDKFHFYIKGVKPYLISGTTNDNKYLNPYLKRQNDKFFNHLNYHLIELKMNNKSYEIGFNSFTNFIKPFLSVKNLNDYFNRLDKNYNDLSLVKDLNKTFKDRKVFKINLSNIDIEKLNKNYLFYKNELKIGQYKVTIVKYDEFLKGVVLKSNFKIHNEIINNFYNDYKKYKLLLNSLVFIVEKLDYDDKYNFILCNKGVFNDILKTIDINNVNWSKTKNDKLLKKIKSSRYEFLDYDDKKDELFKKLNKNKKDLKEISKKLDFYKNELDLLTISKKTNSKKYNKYLKKFNILFDKFDDIQNDLIDIDIELIELDKKQDEFEQNQLEYNKNYSLRLKSYLD